MKKKDSSEIFLCDYDRTKESSLLSQFERQRHTDSYAGQEARQPISDAGSCAGAGAEHSNRPMNASHGAYWTRYQRPSPKDNAVESARSSSLVCFPHAQQPYLVVSHPCMVAGLVYLRGQGLAAVGRGASAGAVLPAFLGRTRDACQHFPSEPRLPTLALSIFFFTCRCNRVRSSVKQALHRLLLPSAQQMAVAGPVARTRCG
jgi:hypothetical protein